MSILCEMNFSYINSFGISFEETLLYVLVFHEDGNIPLEFGFLLSQKIKNGKKIPLVSQCSIIYHVGVVINLVPSMVEVLMVFVDLLY